MPARKQNYLEYKPYLRKWARELRKNGTLGEVLLWKAVRKKSLGVEFHRQVPIGSYIVDFFCHELRLAIEIDGSGHNHPDAFAADVHRQAELESRGVSFLRFSEQECRSNLPSVVETIRQWISDRA
jgi:very-short-patch-repair endonuclease